MEHLYNFVFSVKSLYNTSGYYTDSDISQSCGFYFFYHVILKRSIRKMMEFLRRNYRKMEWFLSYNSLVKLSIMTFVKLLHYITPLDMEKYSSCLKNC